MLNQSDLGKLLRLHREKRHLNQSVIASDAGISVSMLSQIELGKVSPSIDTLLRVCAALGLEATELFRKLAPARQVRIHRRGERLKTERDGVSYEQLVTSPDSGYPAEMFLLDVEPGRSAGLGGAGHEGVEMGYVLRGSARLTVGESAHDLTEGDTVSFNAHLPHRLENTGPSAFRAVWSVVPPHVEYLDFGEERG